MRHPLKATLLVAGLLLLVLLVQVGGELAGFPTWKKLLTEPVGELTGITPAEQPPQEPSVESLIPAPEAREQPTASRVAGQPMIERQPEPAEAPPTKPASSVTTEAAGAEIDTSKTAIAEREGAPVEDDADDVMTREASLVELAEVLATGGDLVRDGITLPRLDATWRIQDLDALAQRYGSVVVDWNDRKYRVITGNGSILDATEFVTLTREAMAGLSNRGLALNRVRTARGWRDAATRSLFTPLEQRFLNWAGDAGGGELPVFTLYVSASLNNYLAAKQLGAIRSLSVDLDEVARLGGTVVTTGTLVVTPRRPVYVIFEVKVGQEIHAWRDPETALATPGPQT